MAQGRSTEIISTIKWIRTSRFVNDELSLFVPAACRASHEAILMAEQPTIGAAQYVSADVPLIKCISDSGRAWSQFLLSAEMPSFCVENR